ncbi:MAG: hypothetical protein IKM02_05720 [Clostridia bacterium]|nr:hypothetical protein [Clostridia bacterium]
MNYVMMLWPHANARYQNESAHLAEAELRIILDRVSPEAEISVDERIGMPMLRIAVSEALSETAIDAVCGHSLMYGLFLCAEDGSLMPVAGREKPWIGQDLPAILKYKGKTNEMFLQMLINTALYSGYFWQEKDEVLDMLDPMCGRATSLFIAANRRWNATGTDIDQADLKEAEKFLKRYFEYHHFKHSAGRESLTLRNAKPAAVNKFTFSDTPEHFKQKNVATMRLVNCDACRVREAFGKNAFHMIVCDLPYGVQHAPQGGKGEKGGLEGLLSKALPGWRECLKVGGAAAVSFNAQNIKLETVRAVMEEAGFEVMRGGAYDGFAHWVEQAVTRDIAVCRRMK